MRMQVAARANPDAVDGDAQRRLAAAKPAALPGRRIGQIAPFAHRDPARVAGIHTARAAGGRRSSWCRRVCHQACAPQEPHPGARPAERRRRTETVLGQVYDGVLREVDPSYAISIASARSQAASAQTGAAVAEVKETVEEIRTVQAAAAARGDELDLRDRLRALPPLDPEWVVQRWREAPEVVWSAVTGLTQPDAQPEAVVADWQRLRPDWVVNAPPAGQLAIAELAAGYGLTALAADLLESAANDAAPRSSYWRARAACIHAVNGNAREARRVLGTGSAAEGTEPLSHLVAAMLDDDLPAVRRVIEEWEPQAAVETVLRASLQTEALLTTSDGSAAPPAAVTAALKALQDGIRRAPASTALRLVRARVLILLVQRGQSNHPDADLRDALGLALSARDARRNWRGDGAEAAGIACEAANLAQDWQTTVKMGPSQRAARRPLKRQLPLSARTWRPPLS